MAIVCVTIRGVEVDRGGPLGALHAAGHEVRQVALTTPIAAGDLIQALQDADALIVGGERYTAEVFAGLPRLRHLARFGAGYDAIDVDAATAAGVVVTNAPGANATAVADLAIGLMLAIARNIPMHDRNVKQGIWRSTVGADLWQRTLGIVGLGRIGQGVARRARGFDMSILAYDPVPNQEFARAHGVDLVPIERVFGEADFVTLHLPASDETDKLVDARLLSLMRPTAFLINAARGRIVDEDALFEALAARRIAGAALDVRRDEPPTDLRFNALDNVVLTPHTAAATVRARIASAEMSAEAVNHVLRGERPEGLVNPEVWDRVRAAHAG